MAKRSCKSKTSGSPSVGVSAQYFRASVTIGGMGGKPKIGGVFNYVEAGDDNPRLSRLYLSVMNRMGVELAEFGDGMARLAGL